MTQTLADEILSLLPHYPTGARIQDLTARLAADYPSVRLAFLRLDEEGRARLLRRGRGAGFYLVPIGYGGLICTICRREFTRSKKSKRATCSLACRSALGWRASRQNEQRCAKISAAHRTPKALARIAEHNRRRWSKPHEREKLSEQNRRQWRDPEAAAKRANSIQKAHSTPAARANASATKKKQWQTPAYRDKTVSAIRRSKGSPEARAKFSKLLRERWQDPVWRQKYLASALVQARRNAEQARGKRRLAKNLGALPPAPPAAAESSLATRGAAATSIAEGAP